MSGRLDRLAAVTLCVLAVLAAGSLAEAQSSGPAGTSPRSKASGKPSPLRDRFELGFGASWIGGYDLGARDATLTGNQVPTGGDVLLFRTRSEVTRATGVDVSLGWRLSRVLVAEGRFGFSRPTLSVRVSDDTEQASPVTATDEIAQYVIEGALLARVPAWALARRRVVPFVTGGAGHLRQLAGERRFVETGILYHAGGGLAADIVRRPTGVVRALAARVDVRVNRRTGGVDVSESSRVWPSAGAAIVVRF
jgi:hypothetical protein